MEKHKAGDLLYSEDDGGIGFITRIYKPEELKEYSEFTYEIYFEDIGKDRYQEHSVDYFKRQLQDKLDKCTK